MSADVSSPASPTALEHEVEVIRGDITQIATELDHRRHELFDWRHQLRKHVSVAALLATATLLAIGVSIGFGILRRRRKARPRAKAAQLRDALARVWTHPERVGR